MVITRIATTESTAWFLLKLFLLFGGLFGIMIGSTGYFFNHQSGYWLHGGLFFGTFMTVILGALHLIRGRRPGLTGAVRVKQTAAAIVSEPLDNAIAQARSTLVRLHARNIRVARTEMPTLLAHMPSSFWSFGEKIRIAFHDLQDGTVEVEISSRPVLVTTIVDYGKNLDNVEAILKGWGTQDTRVQGAS